MDLGHERRREIESFDGDGGSVVLVVVWQLWNRIEELPAEQMIGFKRRTDSDLEKS